MVSPMRTRDDIGAAAEEFCDKVWYDRQQLVTRTESGAKIRRRRSRWEKIRPVHGRSNTARTNLGPYTILSGA